MTIRWDAVSVPEEDLPSGEITYYKLYMDDGLYGDFELITKVAGSITQISVNNLVPGRPYRFSLLAANFNQEGPLSDSSLHYACVPPSGLSPPVLISTTNENL
jgi:hypothetical protein